MSDETRPSGNFEAITPGTALSAESRSVYIGVTGDVVARNAKGADITFKNAVQGSWLPIKTTLIVASGTDATDLVALI